MDYIIHRFKTLDSTNNLAIRMAGEGAPEGTVVVAREQTAGRGRMGRSWTSPPGTGLYLSMVVRPDKPMHLLWQLAFVASLATAEAIRSVCGLDARIKWPNDILIGGRKVCGILVETRSSRQGDQGAVAVVGIGINVGVDAFPPELEAKATSLLLELGEEKAISVSAMESALLEVFGCRYEEFLHSGFSMTLESWRRMECTTGRQVSVNTPDGQISGIALEVTDRGELVIRTETGDTAHVSSGEVLLA